MGTKGVCPGAISTNLIESQSLHLSLSFDALMYGFVALMMMPWMTKSF
jgi:hypothetical protein